ncbi:Clavaminate synthase-like protein [Fomitiporia mediterranea MF3/22]|uniref:Clavaminate synthase-like protein n=1 Tax=Fomitiporia mediterranea (strain MF3/22) TaxID=694068 RepID=UPI0004407475|nr:Clavaminate synthase-like protein [Fomitiporia mediterranea MF3/22]EJD06544.1 Clavaminate synthase-like protein [Fomitiporia mediterranea MF3/22]
MPGLTLPPFPDNIPTHPLLVIDYELLKSGDSEEIGKLWKAATELGFWYLKNHGANHEVEEMFEMGAETLSLLLEEKMKFVQTSELNFFGYKTLGATATNAHGNPDSYEAINISKEDALAYPDVINRTYPSTVNVRMRSTITPFVKKSIEVIGTMYSIFEKQLGLPEGTLLALHAPMEKSGSECRVIRTPPKHMNMDNALNKDKVSLGSHTDVGSLSFLHNRLGGLEVLPPNSPEWQYILPIPGHAICNVGDSLSVFSSGILRSNMHRVVPPPGEQGAFPRWSLVFFSRPSSRVLLRALEESNMVKEQLSHLTPEEKAKYNPGVTQGEWYARRKGYSMLKNRTGPETYIASRGMEHKPTFE